jgi:predicted GNAT family acetyltransferase
MAVIDNTEQSRFELTINGHTTFADYRRDGNILHIPHVEAPAPLRGTGAASELMHGIMHIARQDGLHIHPICSYAAAWMQKHPQFHPLLA